MYFSYISANGRKYIVCSLLFLFLSSKLLMAAADKNQLNGRWHVQPEKTIIIQPSKDTPIMQYHAVFNSMYIDIKLAANTIVFGLQGTEPESAPIEAVFEETDNNGTFYIFIIDHEPVRLRLLPNGFLHFEDESNRIYLILKKH